MPVSVVGSARSLFEHLWVYHLSLSKHSWALIPLHPQETHSWPRAVHPGSRRAEINKTSPNLQSLAFNQGRKVTCWESSSLGCHSLPDMKGLLLKDTYVDAEEWKTREVKLIYCFNLLHCRLNKLKDSCFPSEAGVGRGGRFRLPGWKEKCHSGGQQEKGILERMRPGMNAGGACTHWHIWRVREWQHF